MSYNDDGPSKHDVYVAELVEQIPTSRRFRIVSRVAETVRTLVRKALGDPETPEAAETQQKTVETAGDITSLATDAIAGRLESSSLDGTRKRAEISSAFADASLKNEQEQLAKEEQAKVRAETREIEERTARANLETWIELLVKMGAAPQVRVLPDKRIGIFVGSDLVGILPRPKMPDMAAQAVVEYAEEVSVISDPPTDTLSGSPKQKRGRTPKKTD